MNNTLTNKIEADDNNKKYFKSIFDLLSPNLFNLFLLNQSLKNKGVSKEQHSEDIKKWCDDNDITEYTLKGRNILFEIPKANIIIKHNRATMGFNITLK